MEEKNSLIENLRKRLKCKEEDICDLRRKLDDVKCRLEEDLKCAKMELKQMEKKYKMEQEWQSEKLKTECERSRVTKNAFNEAKDMLNDDVIKIKKRIYLIEKLTVGEDDKLQKVTVRKLREEIRAKDDELCRLNKKLLDLNGQKEIIRSKEKGSGRFKSEPGRCCSQNKLNSISAASRSCGSINTKY